MFQLILGISLGVILLFVILLLITEVAYTYPVWKSAGKNLSSPFTQLAEKKDKRNLRILLLSLLGVIGICLAVYFFSLKDPAPAKVLPQETIQPSTPSPSLFAKQLAGISADGKLSFRLQTKWEEGKLYGNNTITFTNDSVWRYTNCRYLLLDKDGFLLKEILFSSNDVAYIVGPANRNAGVMSKFNIEMGRREYQRIDKLQVILDNKIVLSP